MNAQEVIKSSTKKIMDPIKKIFPFNPSIHQQLLQQEREKIKGFKAKMDLNRGFADKMADFLTNLFGSVWFLVLNAIWFAGWMLVNTGLIPGIKAFDPFPYGLLTMVVSLEAIFLAIIVLISQNRAAKIADLREEIDLQLNVKAKQEITRMLIMLDEIHDHLGLPSDDDAELIMMKQKTDLDAMEKELAQEMGDGPKKSR